MKSADDYSDDMGVSMTRHQLLRGAAALGIGGTALGGLAGCLGGSDDDETAAPDQTDLKRGGTFRLAVSGGTEDILDGQHILVKADSARMMAGWDRLAYLDDKFQVQLELAEELEVEKADQYLIRVRDGVEFHNGKTLSADDVIYSINRTLDKKLGLFGNAAFQSIDPKRMKKLDNRTVRLFLKRPDSTVRDAFAEYYQGIVPDGYAPDSFKKGPLHDIGTGPFKLKSFDPGRRSVHVRNENYWREGEPYFDEVVVISFPDDGAKVNALLSGQVDAMTDVPYAQVPVVEGRNNLKILDSETGAWAPIVMAIDQGPFTDTRVRQAFKLLADRQQMVEQGLSGFGRIANDVPSPLDSMYAGGDFPQREYDPERAKSLLKAAGQEGLSIDLYTAPAAAGMVEGATIFTENAKAGGVNVNLRKVDTGTLYGDKYLKWTFLADDWGTRNYLPQVAAGLLDTSFFNETHWTTYENYPRFKKLYTEAVATTDDAKRKEVVREMQQMQYDDGGDIIWGFKNLVDGYSAQVAGLKASPGTLNLNSFGHGYRTISFA